MGKYGSIKKGRGFCCSLAYRATSRRKPERGLVIQADKESTNEKLMAVLSAARAAGLREVAISTERM